VFKNSAFDVTPSGLSDTFFQTWDQIKHNIIVNWVDSYDQEGNRGLALLSDHTTSYVHGQEHPLGLTLQYSGIGLWGRRYRIDGPTRVRYALVPHVGDWKAAGISTESDQWNEPLITTMATSNQDAVPAPQSLIDLAGSGWALVSATFAENDLLVRLFNAEGSDAAHDIKLGIAADVAEWIELDGTPVQRAVMKSHADDTSIITVAIPRFGVKTLRFANARARK
jgi:alpha-mannosidase